jgi:hypothetical protein
VALKVVTRVGEQPLASAPDTQVIDACRAERRCLVTLDLGLANPLVSTQPRRAAENPLVARTRALPDAAHW